MPENASFHGSKGRNCRSCSCFSSMSIKSRSHLARCSCSPVGRCQSFFHVLGRHAVVDHHLEQLAHSARDRSLAAWPPERELARALTSPARQDRMAESPRKAPSAPPPFGGLPAVTRGISARTADSTVEPLVANEGRAASPVKAFSCRRRGPKASFGVQAWTLDWRCKSSAEQVGSNRILSSNALNCVWPLAIRRGSKLPAGSAPSSNSYRCGCCPCRGGCQKDCVRRFL
jgi:hypothetical protein